VIPAALLAALAAIAPSSHPDDVDRFISVCIDGGKQLLDQSGKLVDRKDIPEIYLRRMGRPTDNGSFPLRYVTTDEGQAPIAIQQYDRKSAAVQWACTVLTDKFDVLSAKQALLERLRDRGIEDVTEERFLPSDLHYENHGRASSNPIVRDKLKKHEQIDRFTLQTADSHFEIFGRTLGQTKLYALSVLDLNEREARSAQSAWATCQKVDCSLPRLKR